MMLLVMSVTPLADANANLLLIIQQTFPQDK